MTDSADDDLGDLFHTYHWVGAFILANVPEFRELQAELMAALQPLTHSAIHIADHSDVKAHARGRIISQATNDYVDLLYEAISGRGRPSVRSARSLFEHLVNFRTVDNSDDESQRYRDHEAIGRVLDLDLNTQNEEEFVGKLRKRVRHWKRGLEKRYRPEAERAVKKYGPAFRRNWSQRNLRDRADGCGLGHEYDFYRLCSAFNHGTAAGIIGTHREIDKSSVIRTGPAIVLTPFALRYGNRYFGMLLKDAEVALGAAAVVRMSAVVDVVEAVLARFTAAAAHIDAQMWPDEPPRGVMYLKIWPDGRREWLMLSTERWETIRADPVGLDEEYGQRLDAWVEEMERANPGRTKPCLIGIAGLKGAPRPKANWQPAGSTLRQVPLSVDRPVYRSVPVEQLGRDRSLYD